MVLPGGRNRPRIQIPVNLQSTGLDPQFERNFNQLLRSVRRVDSEFDSLISGTRRSLNPESIRFMSRALNANATAFEQAERQASRYYDIIARQRRDPTTGRFITPERQQELLSQFDTGVGTGNLRQEFDQRHFLPANAELAAARTASRRQLTDAANRTSQGVSNQVADIERRLQGIRDQFNATQRGARRLDREGRLLSLNRGVETATRNTDRLRTQVRRLRDGITDPRARAEIDRLSRSMDTFTSRVDRGNRRMRALRENSRGLLDTLQQLANSRGAFALGAGALGGYGVFRSLRDPFRIAAQQALELQRVRTRGGLSDIQFAQQAVRAAQGQGLNPIDAIESVAQSISGLRYDIGRSAERQSQLQDELAEVGINRQTFDVGAVARQGERQQYYALLRLIGGTAAQDPTRAQFIAQTIGVDEQEARYAVHIGQSAQGVEGYIAALERYIPLVREAQETNIQMAINFNLLGAAARDTTAVLASAAAPALNTVTEAMLNGITGARNYLQEHQFLTRFIVGASLGGFAALTAALIAYTVQARIATLWTVLLRLAMLPMSGTVLIAAGIIAAAGAAAGIAALHFLDFGDAAEDVERKTGNSLDNIDSNVANSVSRAENRINSNLTLLERLFGQVLDAEEATQAILDTQRREGRFAQGGIGEEFLLGQGFETGFAQVGASRNRRYAPQSAANRIDFERQRGGSQLLGNVTSNTRERNPIIDIIAGSIELGFRNIGATLGQQADASSAGAPVNRRAGLPRDISINNTNNFFGSADADTVAAGTSAGVDEVINALP